ncbi:high mobility group protein B3-like [Diorhabda carinulata]|uniref:high mobility group protein B3-like n=1 Tax=Diorhabda carinulata TaxID=1163345 RepID=UPI0025A10563|nr:high mobility group protein B3-like [Diorhabda carinulata]
MMSDESENDGAYVDHQEKDIYYKKYKLLLEECSNLQRSNEILVFRIQEVNKITKRRLKDIKFFKQRLLNNYEEDWSVIPNLDEALNEEGDKRSIQHLLLSGKIKEEKFDEEEKADKKPIKKTTKRKTHKSEKDPNAPKRPSNPFFQFCQEQRQILMEQIAAELKPGEVEPTKQELTRQLAIRWKTLSVHDRKVYVDRYERSKEKYAAELEEYNMKK